MHAHILSDDKAHGVKLDLVLCLLKTIVNGLKELL